MNKKNSVERIINGPKGISDPKLNRRGKRYVRIRATRAPIQKEKRNACIPITKPSRNPTPRKRVPSAKPIHFPFDTNHKIKISAAKMMPEKISNAVLSSPTYKKNVYTKEIITKEYKIELGSILCFKSYTKSTTKSELTTA